MALYRWFDAFIKHDPSIKVQCVLPVSVLQVCIFPDGLWPSFCVKIQHARVCCFIFWDRALSMLGVFWAFFLNKGHLVGESAVLKTNRQIGNVFFGGDMFFFPGSMSKK